MIDLEKLTTEEVAKLDKNKVVIIPIGATEAHDHLLPINTDNLIAQSVAKDVAKETGCILGIPLLIGTRESSLSKPGNLGVSLETLQNMVTDLVISYLDNKFKKIFILNGHGFNQPSIREALGLIRVNDKTIKIKSAGWWEFSSRKVPHSGKVEAGIALACQNNFGRDKATDHKIITKNGIRDRQEIIVNMKKWLQTEW
ncbi:creatininase family protein [Patescibacteria group bacterium]